MRINLEETTGKLLPDGLNKHIKPFVRIADAILTGTDDNARAQRMALVVFIIRVMSAVIAFASQVLLARWLGTFEYGIFVAVWVVLIVGGSITSIGFPSAVTRLITEYTQKNSPGLVQGTFRASLLLTFLLSSLIATCGGILVYYYPQFVENYYIAPIYLALVCLPLLACEGVVDGIARAYNWTNVAFVPTYILRPLGILFILGIALLMGFEANAVTAMWSGVISVYVNCFIQFVFLLTKLSKNVPKARPEYQIKKWAWIAFPMFLVEGFYVLQTSIDIMIVSAALTPEDTAVYFASTKILALVHFVYFAVRAAAGHRYTAFHTSGDIEGFRSFVQKTVTWTFWPSLFLAGLMVLLGKYLLMLFGPEFVSGEYLIWILALGIVIRASIGPAESLLVMADAQNTCAAIYAVSLIVNVALNLSFIPIFGLAGAAIATTAALAFESAALHAMAKRKLGIHAFIIPQKVALPGNPA